jgi:hypothetical protein
MSKSPERASLSQGDSAAGVRGAIDSLVNGSLVELFHAYDVAVAPSPRPALKQTPTIPELSAAVAFLRRGAAPGRLTLSMPVAVLELTKQGLVGTAPRADWARELANQLMGRVKNRLLHFSVRVDIGPPSTLDSSMLQSHVRSVANLRVYAGRTLRGEILVTLEGMPDESELTYVGAGTQPTEGDTLFF